jgi:hypothetical protein
MHYGVPMSDDESISSVAQLSAIFTNLLSLLQTSASASTLASQF